MAQVSGFQPADRLQYLGGDQLEVVVDVPQGLEGVEQQGGGGAQGLGGLARHHPAVRQHHGACGRPGGLGL